jgi:hypothetical protein
VPIPPTIRRPTIPARAIAAVALILGTLVAGCGQPAASSAVPNGLLALAGTEESSALTAWDPAHPAGVPVDLPDGTTTWIAAGRANVLVATLAKGTTATSRPLDLKSDTLAWRTIEPKDPNGDPPNGPISFATRDPGGRRYAALDGDLLSTDPISLVLIDPTVSTAFAIDLRGNVMAAPPAWIDDDRIVVVVVLVNDSLRHRSVSWLGARRPSGDGRRRGAVARDGGSGRPDLPPWPSRP